jgi:hypothetical protein
VTGELVQLVVEFYGLGLALGVVAMFAKGSK